MKTPEEVAIAGYGAYLPRYRLPSSEVARIWRGTDEGFNREKTVAAVDEDSATMAVESARNAVKMAGVEDLGAIFVGSESKPYAVKPTGTVVAQALGQHRVLAADLEFACKAGTEAIQIVMGLIGSGMIQNGLAIAADAAQGRPGDDLEFVTGCGAAAYLLSRRNNESVAVIEGCVSYVSDTGDFWRRQGEMYPRHLSRFTGEPAYFHHIETAVKMLLDEFSLGPQDFSHAVFHQPNPRFPVEAAQRLGFSPQQIRIGLLNPVIGNVYSASAPLGLAAVLDEAKVGERILLASFGSGAGSDAVSLRVLDAITEKRRRVKSVREMVSDRVKIDYSTYAKFREKFKR